MDLRIHGGASLEGLKVVQRREVPNEAQPCGVIYHAHGCSCYQGGDSHRRDRSGSNVGYHIYRAYKQGLVRECCIHKSEPAALDGSACQVIPLPFPQFCDIRRITTPMSFIAAGVSFPFQHFKPWGFYASFTIRPHFVIQSRRHSILDSAVAPYTYVGAAMTSYAKYASAVAKLGLNDIAPNA